MAFFGLGQQDPYAEAEQKAQDQQTAFQGMKDNLPALGLAFGLSMLARNNGSRNVGQLIGQAGTDALGAYGTWQKMQEMKKRQEQLDKERAEDRDYQRSQDAWRNDMAERKFGLEEAKMAQDMQLARQRLGLEGARLALARQAAAQAAENPDLGAYHKELGGFVNSKTGKFTPLQLPEGYTPPGAGSDDFLPMDAKAKSELYSLGESDMLVGDMIDKLAKNKGKGGTGLVIGSLPATMAGRMDPAGVELRGSISNFSSQIMNALSGAAVSEQEKKRLEGFLPTTTDDYDTLMAKMKGYQDYLRTKAGNWLATYGPHARISGMRVMGGGKKKEDPALPQGFTELR